jgi:hypothetical protein
MSQEVCREEIFEEGEYCDVCMGVENLGSWKPGRPDTDIEYAICAACWADQDKFHEWFVGQIEEALASNPDEWEKLPDGRWRNKKHDE